MRGLETPEDLLEEHRPTDPYGQFADRGEQYRTAIFYPDEGQRGLAEESKRRA
nr:peptide-methionine (S)-S-oxide reductase [Thermococcus sp. JdF3]